MTWTLLVRENCHDCDLVIAWLKAHAIVFEIDDIDRPKDRRTPRLFAAPALCQEGELKAYGSDIIDYLTGQGAGATR